MKIQGYYLPLFSDEEMQVIRDAIFDTKTRYLIRMQEKDKRGSDYKRDKEKVNILSSFLAEIQD